MNGPGRSEPIGIQRGRPVAPFAVVAELSVLYEISSLGTAETEEQLGREAAEKVSRLFGARYFAVLKGPLLQQKPVVMWGVHHEHELKARLMRPAPNQFRFSFPLGNDEVATVFAEQARPVDERETRLYTILARRIQSAMMVLKNLAERKRALETVQRSEERFESVIRSMREALIVTDRDGRVELMNPTAEAWTGWSEAEARGKPLSEVVRLVNENTRQFIEDPVASMLREGRFVGLENHAMLIGRDGTERPIAGSAAPIRDDYGDINGVVLILSDQARERQIQRELREALKKAEICLNIARVMLVALDREGRITLLNRKGEEVLGVKAGDVLGTDWFERFIPERERKAIREVHRELIAGGVTSASEYHENVVLRSDGVERLMAWTNTLLRDASGQIIGILSSGTDITESCANETQIAEHLEELRRWYRVTLGREEQILMLKREINELCKRMGEPPRYEVTM